MITSLELLLNTAFIAVVSAALSTLIGLPLGFWLARLPRTLSRLVAVVVTIPFLLPPFLIGMAISSFTEGLVIDSISGMGLILLAHTIMNAGFIARVIAAKSIEQEQFEAARLDGASTGQIRLHIQIPQLLPAVISAALLVALYSSTSFGLVLTLSDGFVETLETQISLAALRDLDLATAGSLAALQTFLTLVLFLGARGFTNAPSSINEIQRSPLAAGKLSSAVALFSTLSIAGVLLNVLVRSNWDQGLWQNLINLNSRGTRSLLNITVLEAAANSVRNALVVLAITLPIAWLLARGKSRLLPLLPAGISPVVVGLGTLALAGYLPRELTSSWILLPLVQVLFALPIAYQILRPARSGIDSDQLDAAAMDGAGKIATAWFIELPQLKRSIALAASFAALTSLGEFGAASFLAFGSNETLPIVMFQLAGRPGGDNYGMVMATAAIYILLTALILWLVARPERMKQTGHQDAL